MIAWGENILEEPSWSYKKRGVVVFIECFLAERHYRAIVSAPKPTTGVGSFARELSCDEWGEVQNMRLFKTAENKKK